MSAPLNFEREGRNWPHRDASRLVRAGEVRWHVQTLPWTGEGEEGRDEARTLLLLHGTGASTHSFRDLAPLLAERYRVVMVDLPGHGFTSRPDGPLTMARMSALLASLLAELAERPTYAAGHSAGAAVCLRMALDGRLACERLVSLNGALLPFPGLAADLFPRLAKILFLNPIAPRFFSWRARGGSAVGQLMTSTGSKLDAEGLAYYETLLSNRHHVESALSMMAHWDLDGLRRDMPRLCVPLELVVGDADKAIPPDVSYRVRDIVPDAHVTALAGLGHLAHEEAPGKTAKVMIERLACQIPVRPAV